MKEYCSYMQLKIFQYIQKSRNTFVKNIMMIDERTELEQQYFNLQQPEIRCASGNPIASVCMSVSCPSQAFFCSADQCEHCQSKHDECCRVKFTALTSKLQRRVSSHKEFISQIFKAEDEMILALRASRKQIIEKYKLIDLQQKYQAIVESIYKKQSSQNIRGREGYELYMRILQNTIDMKTGSQVLLQQYEMKCKEISEIIFKERENIFSSYTDKIKERDQVSFDIKPPQIIKTESIAEPILVPFMTPLAFCKESKIMIKLKRDELEFVKETLNNPRQIRLLFRASEYNYSASKFHEKCDNISNTFIVAQTEFGRIIGGFASNPWSSERTDHPDQSYQTFLFSVSLKQKFIVSNFKYASYSNSKFGPCFGRGQDLAIVDQCNSSSCHGNFPTCFNGNGIINSQDSYMAFSGAQDGCKFKLLDYEVFEIIF